MDLTRLRKWFRNSAIGRLAGRAAGRASRSRRLTAEQLESRALLAVVIQQNFSNLDFDDTSCHCTPPDTQIAVGPSSVLGAVNTGIVLKSKTGTVIAPPTEASTFFASVATPGNDFGDPYALYDDDADRFYLGVYEAVPSVTHGFFDLAISKSSTPATLTAADWYFYRFNSASEGNTQFPDFPKMGWNKDAIFSSFNQFAGGADFTHNLILSIDKASVLNGGPAVSFTTNVDIGSSTRILIPARMHNQPTGNLEYFVQTDSNATDTVNVVKMTNYLSATPTFATTKIFVSPYSSSPGVPGLTNQIDDRMLSASWMNNRLVAAQNVGVDGLNLARWYQFNAPLAGTPTLVQQGDIRPGPEVRTSYPSIAINGAGDIALTYMRNSPTEGTSMYVSGRLATQPLGFLPPGRLVIAGAALATARRGGDYSATEFDPVTPTRFWSSNQYQLDTSGSNFHWGTQAAKYFLTADPFVIDSTPSGVQLTPVESVTIQFDEPMNKSSFSVADVVSFTGPGGNLKPFISDFSWNAGNTALTINFPTQSTPGVYSLVLGPQIFSASSGLPLDNNSNGVAGETSDNFNAAFNILAVVCENFDAVSPPNLPAGWSSASGSGSNSWATTTTASFSTPNNAFGPNITTVSDTRLIGPTFTYTASNNLVFFLNNFSLESSFDGGVLEISIDGGAFQDILSAGGSFLIGGYTRILSTGFSNPLAARLAWSGNSNGYIQTIVSLPDSGVGHPVRLRWRLGTDNSLAASGWHIDDVCTPEVSTQLSISATSANKNEGNAGDTPFTFTVTRSGNVSGSTTVHFDVAGSGANPANAADFGGVLPGGGVTFNATETAKTITVDVKGDTSLEAHENFTVTLSGATGGATIATASSVGIIRNDDTALAIAATSADKAEGSTGKTPFTFTVTRSGNVSGSTTVNFAVIGTGGSPANAADFGEVLPSGSISFNPTETSKVVTINVSGDKTVEPNQSFLVTLSGASGGANIATPTATGIIHNDDTALTIAATSAEMTEGNSGPTAFTFTVTRSGVVSGSASVNFVVTGNGANPANAADFSVGAFPSGTVNFGATETSKVITINVNGDTTAELDEAFRVTLSGASGGATVTTSNAIGTIRNDDGLGTILTIAPTSANKAEGNAGLKPFTFTVTRSGITSGETTVNFGVIGTGTNPANAGDFGGALPSGSATFDATETSKVITVNVSGDKTIEPDQTFLVTLSDATGGATISTATALGTIRNDDVNLGIVATSADKTEGISGNTPFTFTVTRTGNTDGETTVNFAVAGTGTNPANAGDFGGAFPSGGLTFARDETSKVVTVNVSGDRSLEPDQGLKVTLAGATGGATINPASANGIIRNDDTTLTIAAASTDKAEGNSGDTSFTFTVLRTGYVSGSTSVNFAIVGIGAEPADAADFGGSLPSGSVTFNGNETSKLITVHVSGDNVVEEDELFRISLSGATGGATFVTAAATGTIRNDDTAVQIASTSADKTEGNSGNAPFTFTITRSGILSGSTTVNYSVTATGAMPANGADFGGTLPTGSVVFDPNQTTKVVSVNVDGDTALESQETFLVTLDSASGGATIAFPSATGTIRNDDTSLAIRSVSANKIEGNSGATLYSFDVTRTGLASGSTTVNFAVTETGVSPASASDFDGNTLPSGTVTFNANETLKTIAVFVNGDTTVETDETFLVTLSGDTGAATIVTATATGTIINDDGVVGGGQTGDCGVLQVGLSACTVGPNPSADGIFAAQVGTLFKAAKDLWRTRGLSSAESQLLDQATLQVADLADRTLGQTSGTTIKVDANAADYGWFVDQTPLESEEFRNRRGEFFARDNGLAERRMDLLTVVLHELGHVLGRSTPTWLMQETLSAGRRKLFS